MVATPDLPLLTHVIKRKCFTSFFRTWSLKKIGTSRSQALGWKRAVTLLGAVGGIYFL